MRRAAPENLESAGQDSFVDVVTNLVGIMIVLVIIVGVRAKHVYIDPSIAKTPPPADAPHADPQLALAGMQSTARGLEADIHRVAEQIHSVERELAGRALERENVATLVSAGERQIAEHRGRLEAGAQSDFDLKQQVAALRQQLGASQQDLMRAENDHPPPVELKHYLTPISRTVFGKEVHFRLSQGRIAYVPLDELLDQAKSSLQKELPEASSPTAITEHEHTVGPYAGFELQFTVGIASAGAGEIRVQFQEMQFVPVAGESGESISDALRPTSEFRRHLAEYDASQSTATIWVYPDGFADFREVKTELTRLGFAAAARPLPPGTNVTASAEHGSRSAAQ